MRASVVWVAILGAGCSDYELGREVNLKAPPEAEDTAAWEDTAVEEQEKEKEEEETLPDEECDGIDNDEDGAVDEGFDADGDGITDCEEQIHDVSITLTADDYWEGYADGGDLGTSGGWSHSDEISIELDSGSHVLAFKVWDSGEVITGFLAEVRIDGEPVHLSGDGSWSATTSDPGSGWQELSFHDNQWLPAVPCRDTSPWGEQPEDLLSTGSQWVWPHTDCRNFGTAWFRLELDLA